MLLQVAQNIVSRFENREDEGQGLVEYALIIVLIAVVCVAAVGILGGTVNGVFETINGGL
jgi:pilus assembly protein Flp/PilA